MALPSSNDLYDIFLKRLAEGTLCHCSDMRRHIADTLHLSEEELRLPLPKGNGKTVFDGRVGWVGTYLKKAGLITYPKYGFYQITDAGRELLAEGLPKIDTRILRRYPSFVAFKSPKSPVAAPKSMDNESEDTTSSAAVVEPPEVMMHNVELEAKAALEDELLAAIMEQDFDFFEHLVVTLMGKMGYGDALECEHRTTQRSGDKGIDGIIKADPFGFNTIYLQAKRWKKETPVGRPEVQKFVGALKGKKASKGIFFTTSRFLQTAKDYIKDLADCRVILVDGPALAELMVKYNLGVTIRSTYHIKHLDSDFFPDLPAES